MAGVFQTNVFQNDVFQIGGVADDGHVFQCDVFQNDIFQGVCGVTPAAGGSHLWGIRDQPRRGRRLRRVVEEQRERWYEVLRQAEQAQEAALDRAKGVEANESLREAAAAAQDAINAAREAEAGISHVQRIAESLQAAAKARTHRAMVEASIKAERQARELEALYLEYLLEQDDEESLALLLN